MVYFYKGDSDGFLEISRRYNCCSCYLLYIMTLLSSPLNKKELFINFFSCISLLLVIICFYIINSLFIKPSISIVDSWTDYFFINFFNDIWAGVFICVLLNLLLLHSKKRFAKNFFIYVFLWLTESIIWEIFRPYVLLIFNPFNKIPKALFGDVISYGLGTFFAYFFFIILNVFIRRKNGIKRTK